MQFSLDDLVTFAKRSLHSFVVKFDVCLINLYAHTQQITSWCICQQHGMRVRATVSRHLLNA